MNQNQNQKPNATLCHTHRTENKGGKKKQNAMYAMIRTRVAMNDRRG